jgi:low temperature requirement protein LtrA
VPSYLEEKRVTWVELFFDLVFVFALTQVSALVHATPTGHGVALALIVFVPIWWAWVGTTIHANTHDVDRVADRLGILAVGLCSLFMALAVADAYADRGPQFGVAYFVLRLLLAAMVFRRRRWAVNSFSVAVLVSGPLMVAGGFLPVGPRTVCWIVAGVVDLATPAILRRRLSRVRFAPMHLPERFGLFMIIALGESIVGIGRSAVAEPMSADRLVAVGAAYVLTGSLWWLYFVFAARTLREALGSAVVATDIVRPLLAYAHLIFVAAVIAVSVGLAEVVAEPSRRLTPELAALTAGGCLVYLVTLLYICWRVERRVSAAHLAGALSGLLIIPVAPLLPAVWVLVLVNALVILNGLGRMSAARPPAARQRTRRGVTALEARRPRGGGRGAGSRRCEAAGGDAQCVGVVLVAHQHVLDLDHRLRPAGDAQDQHHDHAGRQRAGHPAVGLRGRDDVDLVSVVAHADGGGVGLRGQVVTSPLERLPQQQAQQLGVLLVVLVQADRVAGDVVHVHGDGLGDALHGLLQDEGEQSLLVAEVGVDELLVRGGGAGDAVDAGSGDAVLGELGGGGVEDSSAGGLGISGHTRMVPTGCSVTAR